MRRLTVTTLCGAMALATSAYAQDTRDAELASSDRALNATYQTLIRRLRPADQASLRAAQRAWIAFRDADCAFGDADKRDCLIQRTDERERQLRETVYFDGRGEAFMLPGAPGLRPLK
ncbi:lysozyme inhibitor LprI family protein [Caulobacter sp. 17J65-9]|uniref:lysozyme inhibitor LprI family protein n=1 Tax=Caulobacter sp. 17J65-9 TaxID=2709382 RepID=UPI0013C6C451|nr:lysozyme inhibitor LprI family protein [Caulobacter sp. 17J65-9]NEX92642.1 DUF1311 domain-containing protein [Caulobacter sp. 17J65-9]